MSRCIPAGTLQVLTKQQPDPSALLQSVPNVNETTHPGNLSCSITCVQGPEYILSFQIGLLGNSIVSTLKHNVPKS